MDLRLPIGLLFGALGALLTVYGLLTPPQMYEKSLGINVNAWWGLVMIGFAAIMLGLAWRASRRAEAGTSSRTAGK
jgi:uncharacterized membrane protein